MIEIASHWLSSMGAARIRGTSMTLIYPRPAGLFPVFDWYPPGTFFHLRHRHLGQSPTQAGPHCSPNLKHRSTLDEIQIENVFPAQRPWLPHHMTTLCCCTFVQHLQSAAASLLNLVTCIGALLRPSPSPAPSVGSWSLLTPRQHHERGFICAASLFFRYLLCHTHILASQEQPTSTTLVYYPRQLAKPI